MPFVIFVYRGNAGATQFHCSRLAAFVPGGVGGTAALQVGNLLGMYTECHWHWAIPSTVSIGFHDFCGPVYVALLSTVENGSRGIRAAVSFGSC